MTIIICSRRFNNFIRQSSILTFLNMIDITHTFKNICLLAEILTNSIDKVHKTLELNSISD